MMKLTKDRNQPDFVAFAAPNDTERLESFPRASTLQTHYTIIVGEESNSNDGEDSIDRVKQKRVGDEGSEAIEKSRNVHGKWRKRPWLPGGKEGVQSVLEKRQSSLNGRPGGVAILTNKEQRSREGRDGGRGVGYRFPYRRCELGLVGFKLEEQPGGVDRRRLVIFEPPVERAGDGGYGFYGMLCACLRRVGDGGEMGRNSGEVNGEFDVDVLGGCE